MNRKNRKPLLRIYITKHCAGCREALRLADEVRKHFVGVALQIIELDKSDSKNPDNVFAVPTFVFEGNVLSLGNPYQDELFERLTEALKKNGDKQL